MGLDGINRKSFDEQIQQTYDVGQALSSGQTLSVNTNFEVSDELAGNALEGQFDGLDKSGDKVNPKLVKNINRAMGKQKLFPHNIKQWVEDNVADEADRKQINAYIDQIEEMSPDRYIDEYKDYKNDDLFKAVLNVYINRETVKAEVDMMAAVGQIEKEMGVNAKYSEKLAKLKENFKTDGNPYREFALKQYEEVLVKDEMEARLAGILRKMEDEGKLDGYKKYDDKLKNAIVAEVGGDKEFEKFVKDYGKGYAQIVIEHKEIAKRRDELTHVGEKEIKKELKNSTQKLIADYMEDNKAEGGNGEVTYDLSEISRVIAGRIGYDNMAIRTNNIDSEMKYIKRDLAELLDVEIDEISDTQVKDLIEFCRYDYTTRNHRIKLWDSAKALAACIGSGVAGGAVAAPNSVDILINVMNYNTNTTNIYNELGALIETHTTQTQGQAFSELVSVGVPHDILKSVGVGALIGLASSVLWDAIVGNPYEFEKACFNLLDTIDTEKSHMTNKNEYIKYLQSLKDGQYEAIKGILTMFPADENGNWDYNDFRVTLARMAGPGSPLNCAEIKGGKLYMEKPEAGKPQAYAAEETVPVFEDRTETVVTPAVEEKQPGKNSFNKNAYRSGWGHIVDNIYNCDDETLKQVFGTRNRAIRALKIVQAITNEDYSLENVIKLVDMSYNGGLKTLTPEKDGFDYNEYLKFLKANTMPKELKLPEEIAGVKRCDISEDERELIANKATITGKANGIKGTPRYNTTPGKTEEKTVREQVGEEQNYYFRASGGDTKTYKDKDERQLDLDVWQKDNPNGTITDYERDVDAFNKAKEEEEQAQKEKPAEQ